MSKQNIFKAIKNYAITNYKKINIEDFILGDAPFNNKCHLNSV